MVRKRVYRDGIQCPRCGSTFGKLRRLPKFGRSRGKQTYRCGQCLYHFIPETERPQRPGKDKDLAVECTPRVWDFRPSAGC